MKINVAWSTEKDEYSAGRACSKKAVLDLIQTKVAFVFNSAKYNQEKFIEGIKQELGTAPIIGCTTNGGIIVPDGYITSEDGFAGMLALGDLDTAVGVAGSPKIISARETGKKVAIDAMKNVGTSYSPIFYFMIATNDEEEEYAKGIEEVIGEVPRFGGSIKEDLDSEEKIFVNNQIFSKGVAVAFFYTNKEIKNEYNCKYHETINSGVVTKTEGKRIIKEIDGIPAMKQYAQWTNIRTKDLMEAKISSKSILKPLGVKMPTGEITLLRAIEYGNKDYSITVSNDIFVNTAVIQMQTDKEEIIKAPKLVLRKLKNKLKSEPAGYIFMYSKEMKDEIGTRIDEMVKMLKEEAKDIPFIMPLTFGEYGKIDNNANGIGKLMISMTAFCK